MIVELLFLFIYCSNSITTVHGDLNLEILELIGVPDSPKNFQLSETNSATRFLREVYSEISGEEKNLNGKNHRQRRALRDENFITDFDRAEIEKCNNLISFSSKAKTQHPLDGNGTQKYLHIHFNMNDIPSDLQLVHSTLRVYHDPDRLLGLLRNMEKSTISVYEKVTFQFGGQETFNKYRIVASLNMTLSYKGWLEFNTTRLLSRWLMYKRFRSIISGSELLIDATTAHNTDGTHKNISIENLGFIQPHFNGSSEEDPFIIGYFNGPQLIEKMQKYRTKREIISRRRNVKQSKPLKVAYQMPKTCERLNFTVNFRDTHMDDWVIAPKKFEAYFCGGECHFPLGSQLNATNHAIVQTLMQLKQPHLPKPCCAPTALDSITILRYLNEDNVNLVKFAQSVVKECGCL